MYDMDICRLKKILDSSSPFFGDFFSYCMYCICSHTVAFSTMSSFLPSTTTQNFGNILSSQHVADASQMAKQTAMDVQKNLSEGNWSLRLLAMLGGLAMIAVSSLSFIGHILQLNWITAIFDIYTFSLGIIIVILESGRKLSFFSKLENNLYKNALFLKYVWGRGIIYFVAGTLQISKLSLVDFAVGSFVCFVGIMYIVIGRQAAKKLANYRSSITPEQLQVAFAEADTDGVGSLTMVQFRQLTISLRLDLSKKEAEAAFLQIDNSLTGRLTYESVQMWWNEGAAEEATFQFN